MKEDRSRVRTAKTWLTCAFDKPAPHATKHAKQLFNGEWSAVSSFRFGVGQLTATAAFHDYRLFFVGLC